MNKKGLELSINFLVIIILMIVVIGFGITIFSDILSTGKEFQETVDENTQRRITNMLNTGDPVVIPQDTAEVNVGESHIFYIGILNEIQMGDTTTFRLHVESQLSGSGNDFNVINQDTVTIGRGDSRVMPVKIEVPEGIQRGKSYIFDVEVCYDASSSSDVEPCSQGGGSRYYLPQKIYLNVR